MRQKPREEDSDRFLLVEGYSDLLFFAEVLEDLGIGHLEGADAKDCFIKDCGSKPKLLDVIEAWIDPERLARANAIGVLVDADAAASATRKRLAELLVRTTGAKLTEAGGWAPSSGRAMVGFFVVPGGSSDEVGELETLVWNAWASAPANAAKKQCIEGFVACMARASSRAKSHDKALIGSLLAIENDEDPRLGPGARAKRFDLRAPHYVKLRAFLEGFRKPPPAGVVGH